MFYLMKFSSIRHYFSLWKHFPICVSTWKCTFVFGVFKYTTLLDLRDFLGQNFKTRDNFEAIWFRETQQQMAAIFGNIEAAMVVTCLKVLIDDISSLNLESLHQNIHWCLRREKGCYAWITNEVTGFPACLHYIQ